MCRTIVISIILLLTLSSLSFPQENGDSVKTDSSAIFLDWSEFADSYFSVVSPTERIFNLHFENKMITYEIYKDDVFIDFYKISSMKDFLRHNSELTLKKLWVKETKKAIETKEAGYSQGLVPDLDLPKIKTPISGIIGEGGKLSVQGSEKINFGGQKTKIYDKKHVPGESSSFLPELKMKNILNVNLQGTVGQKINVFIDHNSEAESDLQNKIRLQYKGEEDEIVQLIEAGDTDLSLPGTKVIGAPPAYKGLFGIKTLAKVGPLDITAVASKEQGESDQATFVEYAREETLKIDDIDYMRRKFFILDTSFVAGQDTILSLNVYIDDRYYVSDTIAVPARAYLNADTTDTTLMYAGKFDYKYPNDFELFRSVLYLKTFLDNDDVLAVSYLKKNKITGTIDTVGFHGTYQPGDTIILKLLKPENNHPSYPTWDYELRNIYSIRSTNLATKVSIVIKKITEEEGVEPTTQDGVAFTKLLGIDKDGDGYVDGENLDEERGYIIFPDAYPFASNKLDKPNPIIYDTTSTNLNLRKYYMEITYKGARTSINIGQLNIIEGSEVVQVNGQTLQRDVDYTIDYTFGQIEFKGRGATLMAQPNAKLTIDYQYAPFFSTASKSLVGVRTEYNLSENNKIGTSWIYRNISTFDERPKLGQEPKSVIVGEIDGSIKSHPNFLTTIVDKLPLLETDQPSDANIDGVVALSIPDPNSMGKVYIDDMEGVKQTTDIGTSMWLWHYGSTPQGKDTSTLGTYYWYEPITEEWIRKGDIFPNLPEDQLNDAASYLRLVFQPKNNDPTSWMSILNMLSTTGEDLTKSRFLEIWVLASQGSLHVDIGRSIPEDAPRKRADGSITGVNDTIDTEDKNIDGLLDSNEDTGLDGVQGKDGDNVPGDDRNDDYPQHEIDRDDYKKLNGTENNDRLDTEDLDRDGSLNTSSRYIEYSISLENPDSLYVAEEHANGWRLLRIPLDDSIIGSQVNEMDWEYVKYARLWLDGFTQKDSIHIYSIEITGTSWENMGISTRDGTNPVRPDEVLFVTQKNTEQNPDYVPPFDPGDDQYGRPKREQSLVLQFENIQPHHKGAVFLQTTRAEDYTIYEEMKLYVKCHEGGPLKFYLRIGGDSTSYYQFERTVTSTWEEITIPFKSLTDLKLLADKDSTHFRRGNLSFVKNPTLTNVKYLELGFVNELSGATSGEIWIDEIRLTSPRRDMGTKMNATGQLKIADFISLNGSISQTDADFQQLNMNQVSQSNITDYQISGSISLGKFFPKHWGFAIPLGHTQNRSVGYPKYRTGSDVILNEEQAREEKTVTSSQSETISFSKTSKSPNIITRLLIDNIKVNAANSRTFSHTPVYLDSTKQRNITGSYSYSPGIKPLRPLNLFDMYYFPRTFGSNVGYSRNWSKHFTKEETEWKLITQDLKRYVSLSRNVTYSPFHILSGNYSDETQRDLGINYENDSLSKRFGEVVNLNKSFLTSLSPGLWQWSQPTLSFQTSYLEDRKPENRAMVEDSFPVRNVGNSNTVSLNVDFALSRLIRLITRIRNAGKDSTAVMGSPQWIAIKVEQFSNFIKRPNVSLSRNRNTSFSLLKERPNWEYQFGLREGVPKDLKHPAPKNVLTFDQKSVTDNFSANTGLNTSIFVINTTYSTNKTTSTTTSNPQISRSTTWPDIAVQFPQLIKFFPKNTLIKNASVSVNYRKDKNENEIVGQGTQSDSDNETWGPSLQMTWARDVRVNVSANFSENISHNYSQLLYETNSQTTGYNFMITYSFSAPTGLKIPLVGNKISFSSNLDAGLDFNYSKNYAVSSTQTGPTNHMVNYMISPRVRYNFSNNINGGLIGNYTMLNDRKQDTKSSTTGLDVWVEFKF
jgi:hypothetical protein